MLILIGEIFISSFKINFVFQFLYLVGVLVYSKNTISIKFLKTIAPLFIVFVIGIIVFVFHSYELNDLIKDISYFIKPILGLLVGYLSFKKVDDIVDFYNSILFVGVLSAIIHLFGIFILGDFFNASIVNLRGNFGFDSFIEIFSFFILLFSKKLSEKSLVKKSSYQKFLLAVLLLSIFFYFSRTMFVVFFLIGFSMLGFTKITKSTLKFIGVAIACIAFLYIYLYSIRIDRNSEGLEGFFYKLKIAPEEIFKTKVDRENHKELWDHWRGYEVSRATALMKNNPESYFIGNGFGSLVNLKFQAPLGTEGTMKYISRLHNGYMFVFYKTGASGFIIYLIFIIKLYIKIYKNEKDKYNAYMLRLLSAIGLFYLFTSLIISGLYISKDAVIFILGGLLSFQDRLKA